MAHQHARVVSSARGRASASSCSVNTPAAQSGSAQRHVRLRHTSSTGRPKHGVSTSRTSRRPWLVATTPHTRHPSTRGADSTTTRSHDPVRPSRWSTATTWTPSKPTSRSQREQ